MQGQPWGSWRQQFSPITLHSSHTSHPPPSHSSHTSHPPSHLFCSRMLPLTPERCFPAQESCCRLPGCVLPALTSPSSSTSPRLHPCSLQHPQKGPALGPCSATDTASSPLEAFGFLHLARQSSLLRQAQRTAHSTHMFFVFLTQFPKFTHFRSLKLPSARVNHQDWQCPCSENKHSILECKRARLSSKEAYAL